ILSALGIILIGVSCFFFIRHGEISVVTFAREFGFTMIIQMLSLALGAGLVMLAAVIYNAAGRPLSWFSSSYLLFFLYFCPFFLGLSIGPACFVGFRKNNPLTLSINAQLFLHIQHLYYILVLVALSGRNIRSSFLIMIPVFFYNASLLINILFKFQSKRGAWMYVHLLCQIIPFMWFSTNSVAQFSTFIPMQGRSGAGNPEILMAVFCIMYGVFLGGYLVPLITMFRSPRITTLLFVLLWIVGIILMVTPLGFPFREAKSPQRVAFYHMNRQFHELSGGVRRADSGFFVSTGDSFGQSAIQDTLGTSQDLNDECAKEFLCGFPFSISSGSWYPADLATIPDTDVALTLTQREDLADGSVVLHFALQGPDRMSLLISPEPEGILSEWSFEEPVPNRSNGTYSYRSALFITYTNFKLGVSQPSDTTEFWLKITNAPNVGKVLDISVTAHYIWHQDAKSSEFQSKVDALPSWTTVHEEETAEFNAADEERPKTKKEEFLIPFWVSPIVLGIGMLLFYTGTVAFHSLPDLITLAEERDNQDAFIGERARNMLEEFVKIGPKIVGSEANEVLAVEFILREIETIDSSRHFAHTIEVDVSTHDGSFGIGTSTSTYNELQNIVVRVKPSQGPTPAATLLVNSHYDTVPTSPGASDAGIMVVVMLETLRKIVQSPTAHRHNIVFLFNGAEEIGLKAAHGFITGHPWRHNITALVNLDSSGSGGREILFQAGPGAPWLLNLYAKYAKHPYGAAMGEELFQSGFVPSDTDFRIFRDFGGVQGLDMAYSYNGYVYHTKYDRFETIHKGTFQHTGDNVLALVKGMANSLELDVNAELPTGPVVFFDFMGWFMISYTEVVGMIINSLIVILLIVIVGFSVYSMCRSEGISFQTGLWELLEILGIHLASIAVGIGLCLLLMVIYRATGRSLAFYSELWLLYGIYFSPFYLGLALGPVLYLTLRKKLPLRVSQEVQLFLHANALILGLVLIVMTAAGIRSAYLLLTPLIFYCASSGISAIFGLINHRRVGWIYFHILGVVLPFIFYAYLSTIAFTTFIPMAGRDGPESSLDMILVIFSCAMAFFLGGFIVPLIGLCTRRWWVYGGLFGVFTIVGIILLATPIGFPYRAETSPQRYWIFHTSRNFHEFGTNNVRKSDSGYMLLAMDTNSYPSFVEEYVPEMKDAQTVEEECEKEIFCGFPFYRAGMLRDAEHVHWIPAAPPHLNSSITLTRITNQIPAGRMAFQVEGPSRVMIYISPAEGISVRGWSFQSNIHGWAIPRMPGRRGHPIVHTSGKINRPFSFWIELDTPDSWPPNTPQVTIGVSGHFTHYDQEKTADFRRFTDSFPDWADVTAWMAGYEVFEF
uniref:FXNA-like protease n=1 Tax=Lutzomyia longipalpis TaxID=7200 RepID=A0A1B0CV17_LUTLO